MQAPLRPRWRNPAWLATSDQWQCCWKWMKMVLQWNDSNHSNHSNHSKCCNCHWFLMMAWQMLPLWCFNLAFQNAAENDGFLMVSNGQITGGLGLFLRGPIWSTDRQWLHTLTQQGHAYWVHSWHSCIGYIHLCSHVSKKIHPQLNSDLNWPRPICLNWLIHQFWYPKWDSPKMTQFCWSHSFEIVAPLWLQTSDSSAMVPVWVLSIGSFVETRCAYVYACMYMVVDQNSFIRERPFFANKNVTFAKLSRTPCLYLSRNLC